MTPHAHALLRYYAQHHRDRRLPWRRPREPLARVAMVEGLLAQTQASVVGRAYDRVFAGIETPEDWLGLTETERRRRVNPLGYGSQKLAAVDSIARAMIDGVTLWPVALERLMGLGPYTAGMVGILFGAHAAPVDTNLERVGKRAAIDGDPHRWVRDLIRAARGCGHSHVGRAPAYEVVSAVLDIGATRCRSDAVACHRCPLGGLCASRRHIETQAAMDLPDPPMTRVPRWGHIEVRAINVRMPDWVTRALTVEAGWTEAIDDTDPHPSVDQAIRVVLVEQFSRATTGEFDVQGMLPDAVAQRVADLLPGSDPWCRVVLDEGVGTITAWGIE